MPKGQNSREVEMDSLCNRPEEAEMSRADFPDDVMECEANPLQCGPIVGKNNNSDIRASSTLDFCEGLGVGSRTQEGLALPKDLLQRSIVIDSNNAVALFRLAEMHENVGENSVAADYYNRFLGLIYCGFSTGCKSPGKVDTSETEAGGHLGAPPSL